MPQILELKEIEGNLWCRIPRNIIDNEAGSVSLYTPAELTELRKSVKRECMDAIREMDQV